MTFSNRELGFYTVIGIYSIAEPLRLVSIPLFITHFREVARHLLNLSFHTGNACKIPVERVLIIHSPTCAIGGKSAPKISLDSLRNVFDRKYYNSPFSSEGRKHIRYQNQNIISSKSSPCLIHFSYSTLD